MTDENFGKPIKRPGRRTLTVQFTTEEWEVIVRHRDYKPGNGGDVVRRIVRDSQRKAKGAAVQEITEEDIEKAMLNDGFDPAVAKRIASTIGSMAAKKLLIKENP